MRSLRENFIESFLLRLHITRRNWTVYKRSYREYSADGCGPRPDYGFAWS
jgi:hypothetical protein